MRPPAHIHLVGMRIGRAVPVFVMPLMSKPLRIQDEAALGWLEIVGSQGAVLERLWIGKDFPRNPIAVVVGLPHSVRAKHRTPNLTAVNHKCVAAGRSGHAVRLRLGGCPFPCVEEPGVVSMGVALDLLAFIVCVRAGFSALCAGWVGRFGGAAFVSGCELSKGSLQACDPFG